MARTEEPQLFVLWVVIPSRSTERETPEILFRTGLPQSQQGGESARLGGQGGEPRLLSWPRECCAGSSMASRTSGVLAAAERATGDAAGCAACVTRSLPNAID